MGVDYHAYTMIGVLVPIERLYKEQRVRSCEHQLPGDAAFCPRCGKAAYRIEAQPIYDEDHDMLGPLTVMFGTDRAYVVIGELMCEADTDSKPGYHALPKDLDGIREKVERALNDHNLPAAPIGLYTVLYCSY